MEMAEDFFDLVPHSHPKSFLWKGLGIGDLIEPFACSVSDHKYHILQFHSKIMKFTTILFVTLFVLFTENQAQPKFITPLDGVQLRDFFIVNYVDHDTTTGIGDFNCGDHTYDGHQGTDFILRNFRQMDSGVTVRAADAGVVFAAIDTAFDRNKAANLLGFQNYVGIAHKGGYYSYYAHLRKHSLQVKIGDTVKAGQAIGLVGSAGNSISTHLHFEVWTDKALVDPFHGTCNTSASLWVTQPPYITDFGIIDAGLANFLPTYDTLSERPATQTNFTKSDSTITMWIEAYGAKKGDSSKFEWYTPSGALWFSYSFSHTSNLWYYYWWSYINTPTIPGAWNVRYLVNNQEKSRLNFTVEATSDVLSQKIPDEFGLKARLFSSDGQKFIEILAGKSRFQGEISAILFDERGKTVARISGDNSSDERMIFSLPTVSHGVYFARFVMGEQMVSLPILIE